MGAGPRYLQSASQSVVNLFQFTLEARRDAYLFLHIERNQEHVLGSIDLIGNKEEFGTLGNTERYNYSDIETFNSILLWFWYLEIVQTMIFID